MHSKGHSPQIVLSGPVQFHSSFPTFFRVSPSGTFRKALPYNSRYYDMHTGTHGSATVLAFLMLSLFPEFFFLIHISSEKYFSFTYLSIFALDVRNFYLFCFQSCLQLGNISINVYIFIRKKQKKNTIFQKLLKEGDMEQWRGTQTSWFWIYELHGVWLK